MIARPSVRPTDAHRTDTAAATDSACPESDWPNTFTLEIFNFAFRLDTIRSESIRLVLEFLAALRASAGCSRERRSVDTEFSDQVCSTATGEQE